MSKKKVVITGLGSMGNAWLRGINNHEDWELIGIVDTNTELLGHIPEMSALGLDEDAGYISIDDAVKYGEKPDLNVIATPIYNHHVLVKESMDMDINVFCEKNMASTITQAKQMVQCALDKPELCTGIGTNYRYSSARWTARQFFHQENNPIGEISRIKWESGGNWGEKRTGWRRWLQEIYLEDMCVHWFDLLRYITGLDPVQVYADTFIPKYSQWQGSSTCFVNLALAHPDDFNHRHNWVWVQLYGDWQRRGPSYDNFEFFCEKGQAKFGNWGMELKIYRDDEGKKFEEDGFLAADAGPMENFPPKNGRELNGHELMLEMMSQGIDSKGKKQPGTHFAEAFKSFAIGMGAIESSKTGKAVYVPDYWKGLLDD
jgi:predicted dehydrogenase